MKRGEVTLPMGLVVGLILLSVVFLLYTNVFVAVKDTVEGSENLDLCRYSVLARKNYLSQQAGAPAASLQPLLCQTNPKQIPEQNSPRIVEDDPLKERDERKKQVLYDMAENMANCWYQFGEGSVPNPFLQSTFADQQCFMCYVFTLNREKIPRNNDRAVPIRMDELTTYLVSTPYRVDVRDPCHKDGGFCYDYDKCPQGFSGKSTKKCAQDGETSGTCCFAPSPCENKGGYCANECSTGHVAVNHVNTRCSGFTGIGKESSCCFAPDIDGRVNIRKDLYSYADYMQEYDGPGYMAFQRTNGDGSPFVFNERDQYGIMFVGSKKNCHGACAFAAGTGTAAVFGVGLYTASAIPGGTFALLSGGADALVGASILTGKTISEFLDTEPNRQGIVIGNVQDMKTMCPGGIRGGLYDG